MPTGWETDEEEAERNADPTTDEDMRRWSGEGRYARLEGKLEEMERGLLREALTAWSGFAGFCARHGVEPDAEGVEEYTAIITELWFGVSRGT